jgi:hypothetical protein
VSLDVDQYDMSTLDHAVELQTLSPIAMNMHAHIARSANARWAVSRMAPFKAAR